MPQATVGRRLSFNGNEPVTCVLHEGNRKGVQIVADGFNIEDITVIMISAMDVESEIPPPDNETNIHHAMVGKEGFAFKGIRLEDFTPGGSYGVTIIQ